MGLTRLRAEQISDIDYKQAVRVVATTNITNLNGGAPNAIDGVNLVKGDRVLVKAQDTASQNGLYYVTTLGTGNNGVWQRSLDGNQTGEIQSGMIVMVTEGDSFKDTQWKLTTNNPIVVGTTPLTFELNTSTYQIFNGNSSISINSLGGNAAVSINGIANVAVFTTSGFTANNIITDGNLTVGQDLVVNGNLTYVNVSDLNIEDPIIGLGRGANNAPLTTNDGKDRGEQLWYYTTQEQSAFIGYDNSAGKLIAAANVNINNEIVTVNSYGTLVVGTLESADASVTGNVLSGNLLTGGTVSATGNIQSGNLLTTGTISATGNITGNFYSGNGRQLTGQGQSFRITAANSQAYLVNGGYPNTTITLIRGQTYLFEVAAINHPLWIKTDPVTGTGNAYTSGVTNNGTGAGTVQFTVPFNAPGTLYYVCQFHAGMYGTLSTIDGSVIQNGNSNVQVYGNGNVTTSIGGTANITVVSSDGLNVSGNVVGNNIKTTGLISASGNVVSDGNVQSGNIVTTGIVTATGNIIGSYIIGNGSQLTGLPAGYSNSNAASFLANLGSNSISTTGTVTANSVNTSDQISAGGNVTGANFLTAGLISAAGDVVGNGNMTANGYVSAAGNITGQNLFFGSGQVSGTGNIYANNIFANITGNIDAGGSNTEIQFNDDNVLAGSPGLTFNKVSNAIVVAGNVTGANFLTAGLISAAGDLTANNLLASGQISATSNLTAGNLLTTGTISATSNLTAGNLLTAGLISATANLTAGNLLTAGLISASGNIFADTFFASAITATGNIRGANLIGTNLTGTLTTGSQTNISLVGTLTSLSVSGNIQSSTNIGAIGTISAAGNVQAGNVIAGANVVAGNINTTGAISASGNITGNYFIGNGSQLTGINVTVSSISDGDSNVVVNGTNGNVTIGINGTANTVEVSPGELTVYGVWSNPKTITSNVVIGNNINSMLIGPISVDPANNIFVPTGSTLNII